MQRSIVMSLSFAALAAAALTGCDRPPRADAQSAPVVDSVVPRDIALQRFREGLTEPESLTGAAPSRDALVRRFVRALESRDTAALVAMTMSRAEYAWLLYPTDPQGLPPYDLSPGLYWFMLETRGMQGLANLLGQRAGSPLHVVGYSCDPVSARHGANRVYGPCLVRRLQAPGDTLAERLFGPILERGGRFKFVNYANKL